MVMSKPLTLISHHLCPYVQRAVIALTEKTVDFDRTYIDLSNKPDWFTAISPLGKTPVLMVNEIPIFESAVILEYLEDTQAKPLHPADPLKRAEHRSWMEFGSSVLNDIAGFYSAPDENTLWSQVRELSRKFEQLEGRIVGVPYFDGQHFSLVDAVFGPVFRYFDVFDQIGEFDVFEKTPMVAAWRQVLSRRPSIKSAVTDDYEQRLLRFLEARDSQLSREMLGSMLPLSTTN